MSNPLGTQGYEANFTSKLRDIFSFPHPVNEVAARWVAAMVAVLAIAIILSDLYWLMFLLAYGFLARVLTGPKLSPMGLLATRILVPQLGHHQKLVAGPPKRFAQFVGLTFSITALALFYGFGFAQAAEAVLAILIIFALMESILGFCAGCSVFNILIKLDLIPEEACKRCADFKARP